MCKQTSGVCNAMKKKRIGKTLYPDQVLNLDHTFYSKKQLVLGFHSKYVNTIDGALDRLNAESAVISKSLSF